MGLDMYLYRIKKPTDRKEFHAVTGSDWYDEYEEQSLIRFDRKELRRDAYKDLKPFVRPIRVMQRYIDLQKIADSLGGGHVYVSFQCCDKDGIRFGFSVEDNPKHKSVELTVDELENGGFIGEKEIKQYITAVDDVAYWRKAYDLRDCIYDMLQPRRIENCGYYLMDKKKLDKINEFDDRTDTGKELFLLESDEAGETGVFYHEWY